MIAAALVASLTFSLVPLREPIAPQPPLAPAARARTAVAFDHLRPQGSRAAYWLREAVRVSPTVRRLAERIERSDVIVYLDVSHGLGQGVSACLTWMAGTASHRMVRATFRVELPTLQAVSLLAHELAHAVEVVDHPEVRSERALLDLYARIGRRTARTGLHWDTDDAIAVGGFARLEAAGGTPPPVAALRHGGGR